MKKRETGINRSRVLEIALEGGREWKFCLGKLQLFNAVVLKFKTWYNRNDYSCKWRLHRVLTWKLLLDVEEMKLLISKDLNLLRGIFLMGEISKFLAVAYDFPPSPGFPRGGQSTPGGCNIFLIFLVRREIPAIWFWEITLLDIVLY